MRKRTSRRIEERKRAKSRRKAEQQRAAKEREAEQHERVLIQPGPKLLELIEYAERTGVDPMQLLAELGEPADHDRDC